MAEQELTTEEKKQKLKEELAQLEAEEKAEKAAAKKKHEANKTSFLIKTINGFKEANRLLKSLKDESIIDANKFYREMYALHGKEPKEQKNITVESECGKYKVVVESKEKLEFTPEAQVHIDAVREIIQKKFESRNKGMFSFMDSILMRNTKGEYDPKLLSKAKRKARELGYEDMIVELDKLQDCQIANGTATYCRAYERTEKGGWSHINIQFSTL